ncbi:MAG: hypothetical protein ACK6BZ_11780 [Candidatus Kapaibacterium sp.]
MSRVGATATLGEERKYAIATTATAINGHFPSGSFATMGLFAE